MRCGLLGRKLTHSYSPQIHSLLGSYCYDLFETEPENLSAVLNSECYDGLNVTIPYKKEVIPYCHLLSPLAQKLGAVNTIVRKADGSLVGHNTDYFGFRFMVEQSGLSVLGKKVLVLGSGGASVTVKAVLKELGAEVIVISRSGRNHYNNLYLHADASVIVNTTPVGMYPYTEQSPIDLDGFPDLEGVLDLIYNPARTALIMAAEKRGLTALNGLPMLVAQAKESAEWFTGASIDNSCILEIHRKLQRQMENIVLIGMPGCGKTEIGKAIADNLGRPFVDVDEMIVQHTGNTIAAIFAQSGEETFRKLETAMLQEVGMQSGLVIATGGGCVTKQENYPYLHQNGRILWLQREIARLPLDGRPLSQSGDLTQMYKIRKPLYEAYADCSYCNDTTIEQVVKQILNNEGYL